MNWLHELWKQLWITVVVAVVLLALYTSAGRQLVPLLETLHPEIEEWLSTQIGHPVRMDSVRGDWVGLSPIIHIEALSIGGPEGIRVKTVRAELDPLTSIVKRMPVFSQIDVHGVRSHGTQIAERAWQLAPDWIITIPEPDETQTLERPVWVSLLEAQESIYLSDWELSGTDIHGHPDDISLRKVHWRSKSGKIGLRVDMAWGREQLANIRFHSEIEGDLWPWKNQSGRVYLEVDEQEWTRWIPDDLPADIRIKELRAGISGWLNIRGGDLESVLINATMPAFSMTLDKESLEFTDGVVLIAGQQSGNDWHLRVRPEFAEDLPFSSLSISKVFLKEGASWQMGFPSMDLAQMRGFLARYNLLPPNIAPFIDGTAPEGSARDLRISFLPKKAGSAARFDVRTQIELTSKAYRGIPAFTHLNGDLHLQPQGGALRITDNQFELQLDGIYDEPWLLQDVKGVFRWHLYPNHGLLLLDEFRASINNESLIGSMLPTPVSVWLQMNLPNTGQIAEGSLSLLLNIPEAPLLVRQQLIPNIVDPAVTDWLDNALFSGMAHNATFLLQTKLGGVVANSVSTQLALDFSDVDMQYMLGWPMVQDVSGRLWMNSPSLDVWINHGSTLGGVLTPNSGYVQLRSTANGNRLTARAKLSGQSDDALRYFTDTPLRDTFGDTFKEWDLTGDYQAGVNLTMLLGPKNNTPNITLDAQFKENSLYLNDLKLPLANLTGDITYNTRKGLSASMIRADLLGGSFQGKIQSKVSANDLAITLSGTGEAEWQSFKEWQPLFLFDPITGKLDYSANLAINNGKVALNIESNLKGTNIKLPYPVGKNSNTARSLKARIEAGSPLGVQVHYANLLSANLALGRDGVERGQVMLGNAQAILPAESGVEVRGEWPHTIKAQDWWDAWLYMQGLLDKEANASGLIAAETEELTVEPKRTEELVEAIEVITAERNSVQRVDIKIEEVMAGDLAFGPTNITALQETSYWGVNINSRLLRGFVQVSKEDLPLNITLDYLHFPQSDVDDESTTLTAPDLDFKTPVKDSLAHINPADFPALDMTLKELFVGSRNYGAWTFTNKPLSNGAHVILKDTDIYGLHLKGDLFWTVSSDIHSTQVSNMQLTSRDVGKIQRGFRLVPFIEGKNLDGTVNLNWLGSPVAFNTTTLDGNAEIRIRNGLVVAEGAGALKAFGALNINSMVRRLKLDFSDFSQSGLSFDTLKASMVVKDHVLTLTEPLSVDGPSGKFLTSGYTNLNTEELNMKLAVTLPVTGTLPLVAVLAGFAPPVAASIYVTERLIGDELARFTSASYDIRGTWDNPEMKMNKAFDDNVEGKQTRSLRQRFLSIFGIDSEK